MSSQHIDLVNLEASFDTFVRVYGLQEFSEDVQVAKYFSKFKSLSSAHKDSLEWILKSRKEHSNGSI